MKRKISEIGEQIQNDLVTFLGDFIPQDVMDKVCQIAVDNLNEYHIGQPSKSKEIAGDELTAYDYTLLKALGDTKERKTLYQLSLRVDFDDATLIERIAKLTKLGYCKEYQTQSAKRYGRI